MGANSQIVVAFDSREELAREFETNLRHGGTFARGATGFDAGDPCDLVLVHPDNKKEMLLPASVVWVALDKDAAGVGVSIQNFTPAIREQLFSFVNGPCEDSDSPSEAKADEKNLHVQLRGLNPSQQQKIARGKDLNARIVLERMYGKMVWEAILRNSQVTIPEVARIARMGALPIPLIELICSNTTWIRAPHVRRALLGNPKVNGGLVEKILRMTPPAELKLIPKQTAYSPAIRAAARKLMGD